MNRGWDRSMYGRADNFDTWNPASWDCMQVTDVLMNAAEHLGMSYKDSRYLGHPRELKANPYYYQSEHYHHDLTAAKILDYLAWFHNHIRILPTYSTGACRLAAIEIVGKFAAQERDGQRAHASIETLTALIADALERYGKI